MSVFPQFKVLNAIVEFVAVLVVDDFMTVKVSAKVFFHDEPVFGDVLALVPLTGWMIRNKPHAVAASGDIAALPAIRILAACLDVACHLRTVGITYSAFPRTIRLLLARVTSSLLKLLTAGWANE
jgi:hypothetical protein